MPQIEKTFKIDMETLEDAIHTSYFSLPLTYKRGRWETTVNGVKSVLIVYEQHAEPVYVKPKDPPDWLKEWDDDYKPTWHNLYARDFMQQQPHYSISIMLVQHGDEIQLCAMSSGSGQEHLYLPDSGAEWGIYETLEISLTNLEMSLEA